MKYALDLDYAFELQETIDELFSQGADEDHDEKDMMDKLNGLNWNLLLHPIMDGSTPLFEYTVTMENGKEVYKGTPLAGEHGYRLYADTAPATKNGGVSFQRSMELWLLTDMTLLVTSCFRQTAAGVVTDYRTIKGCGLYVSDFAVDYDEIAMLLKSLSNLAMMGGVPFYEF